MPNEAVISRYDLLRRGAGVHAIPSRTIVRVVGDDRISFLHGMCSNDMRNARAGQIVPALFLTEHAHVIADFFAWIADDSILLDVDATLWTRARQHLEKLLVADDVEFEDQSTLAVIDIEGPRAADAVCTIIKDAPSLKAWQWTRAGDLSLGHLPRFGADAYTMLMERDRTASALSSIRQLGPEFGEVNPAEVEILRVENGIARVGLDTGDKTIALEARLNRAISFDKGCYVGQETIERATARGGLKKKLYGVRLDGPNLPETGSVVRLDGKEVGRITSAVNSPGFGPIGLAILNHSAWELGTRLLITDSRGEVAASVCDLPFS